jgi:hypothetical protein
MVPRVQTGYQQLITRKIIQGAEHAFLHPEGSVSHIRMYTPQHALTLKMSHNLERVPFIWGAWILQALCLKY